VTAVEPDLGAVADIGMEGDSSFSLSPNTRLAAAIAFPALSI
jgi:hypothetical protein